MSPSLFPSRLSFAKPLALALALAAPGFALAGGTVQIETGSGKDSVRSTIDFDGAKLRMAPDLDKNNDTPAGEMIFRDGKVYAVVTDEGTPMVMEMGGMMKMMGGMLKQQAASNPDAFGEVNRYYGLTATGRTETVGGLRGEVYRLDYETKDGQRKSDDVVLGTQSTLREMTESMMRMSAVMSESMGIQTPEGSQQLEAEFARKKVGVLRFGQDYRVLSVSSITPPASRFVLPAEPTEMPQLPAGMSLPGFGGEAGANGSASTGLGGIFGQKAERQKERIEARGEVEADAATDRAVDKVLDKAFDKIFGGQ